MFEDLIERNERFAAGLDPALPPLPARRLVVVACMDQRVDPAMALGLELGDAMVLRNAGGRVTPSLIRDLELLDRVAARRGSALRELELMLMPHTECGAGGLADEHDELLAAHFGVTPDELPAKSPGDPWEGVRVDIEALAADPRIPASLSVTGLVYDTASGRVELVERRSPLRDA